MHIQVCASACEVSLSRFIYKFSEPRERAEEMHLEVAGIQIVTRAFGEEMRAKMKLLGKSIFKRRGKGVNLQRSQERG